MMYSGCENDFYYFDLIDYYYFYFIYFLLIIDLKLSTLNTPKVEI